jgi:hypothetical protein
VSWFGRFIGWAALLAVPCWLLSGPWQRGLAALVNPVLAALGNPGHFAAMDVGAPFDIGMFAALCLASRRSPRRVRRRALAIGIPSMVAIEVAVMSVALGIIGTRGNTDPLMRAGFYLTNTIPWVSGPALWVAWLGGWELREPRSRPLDRT